MDSLDRCVILLVESRRMTFTESVLGREDIDVVLLRWAGENFGQAEVVLTEDYLARTRDIPTFILDDGPLEEQARRFLDWTAETGVVPTHFCNQFEELQATTQRFARLIGLPSLSDQQVAWVRNKMTMKDRYAELGIPHAAYRAVSTTDEVASFAADQGWPVVLKPVDSGGCVGTYRIADVEELSTVPPLDAGREWMVEQYIAGTEYQLCALVAHGRVLDAYLSLNPAPVLESLYGAINANITLAPHEPPPVDAKALSQRLADGLGIRRGYLHGELFVTEDGGFYMSEIAARMSGCEVPMNHGLSYGFDIMRAILETYLDRVPELTYTRDRAVGDLMLPVRPGRVRAVSTNEDLLALPGVISSHVSVRPGDELDPPRASYASTGYVQVSGATAAEVEQRMHHVLDRYVLDMDPLAQTVIGPVHHR